MILSLYRAVNLASPWRGHLRRRCQGKDALRLDERRGVAAWARPVTPRSGPRRGKCLGYALDQPFWMTIRMPMCC